MVLCQNYAMCFALIKVRSHYFLFEVDPFSLLHISEMLRSETRTTSHEQTLKILSCLIDLITYSHWIRSRN